MTPQPDISSTPARVDRPDWMQANPRLIEAALVRAQAKPSGGWFVVGSSRDFARPRPLWRPLTERPAKVTIDGRELVLWRDGARDRLWAAPAACPHMGADLSCGRIESGRLICPWHGLALGGGRPGTDSSGAADGFGVADGFGAGRYGAWRPLPVYDDGVLVWVQLDGGPGATERPTLAARPSGGIDAVITKIARCEPEDVIANRLDPWHGVHLHPYAFSKLRVTVVDDDALEMDVTYRVAGRFGVPVTARFHCPGPRTIVMTIIGGEGTGSVVETHATPVLGRTAPDGPRTAIIEATIAASDRTGFRLAAQAAPAIRPIMRIMAARLWTDDAAYAERRYALRTATASVS